MARPARAGADSTGGAEPAKPDPLSPGWTDVRAGMITEAVLMRLDVEELALAVKELGMPGGDRRLGRALEIARRHADAAERWEAIARRCVLDESVLEAARAQAYAQGVADCRAARGRLGAVPDAG